MTRKALLENVKLDNPITLPESLYLEILVGQMLAQETTVFEGCPAISDNLSSVNLRGAKRFTLEKIEQSIDACSNPPYFRGVKTPITHLLDLLDPKPAKLKRNQTKTHTNKDSKTRSDTKTPANPQKSDKPYLARRPAHEQPAKFPDGLKRPDLEAVVDGNKIASEAQRLLYDDIKWGNFTAPPPPAIVPTRPLPHTKAAIPPTSDSISLTISRLAPPWLPPESSPQSRRSVVRTHETWGQSIPLRGSTATTAASLSMAFSPISLRTTLPRLTTPHRHGAHPQPRSRPIPISPLCTQHGNPSRGDKITAHTASIPNPSRGDPVIADPPPTRPAALPILTRIRLLVCSPTLRRRPPPLGVGRRLTLLLLSATPPTPTTRLLLALFSSV